MHMVREPSIITQCYAMKMLQPELKISTSKSIYNLKQVAGRFASLAFTSVCLNFNFHSPFVQV